MIIKVLQKRDFDKYNFREFAKKMQTSIKLNLESKEDVTIENLETLINKVSNDFLIIKENSIEDMIHLYYNFNLDKNNEIWIQLNEVLLSKTKSEEMKIEEITQILLTN